MNIEFGQVFTQILAFLVMYWVLKRWAWKPILKLLDDRKNKIQSEFDSIEDQKKKIDLMIEEYNEKLSQIDKQSQEKFLEVVEKGKKAQNLMQIEAHAQAKEILKKAREDVQREIAQAKVALKKDVVNMAIQATEKILETHMTPENKEKILSEFMNKGLNP